MVLKYFAGLLLRVPGTVQKCTLHFNRVAGVVEGREEKGSEG
jgi:hypothetical protein